MPEKTATTYPVATKHEQISAAANEPVYFSGCFQRSTLFKSRHRGAPLYRNLLNKRFWGFLEVFFAPMHLTKIPHLVGQNRFAQFNPWNISVEDASKSLHMHLETTQLSKACNL
jgi:hypothetical protein